jgi:hypothetical protein
LLNAPHKPDAVKRVAIFQIRASRFRSLFYACRGRKTAAQFCATCRKIRPLSEHGATSFPATVKIERNTFVLLDSGAFLALQSRKPLLIYAASPQSRLRNLK